MRRELATLRAELRERERELRAVQVELLDARAARARAEQSCKEAWTYAKDVARALRHGSDDDE